MQRVYSSWSRSGRSALGGLFLSSMLAASLLAGCGTEDVSDEAGGDAESLPGSAGEVQQALESAPRIATLTAVPQATVSSRTPTLLEATLASGASTTTQVQVDGDDGKVAVLRDNGTSGDRQAGDGVFTGAAVIDLATERAHNRAIAAAVDGNSQLTDPTFDGRELVGSAPLRAQPDAVFQPGARIPLRPIGISTAIVPANSLIIRHPGVVNDPTRTFDPCTNVGNPNGVWTFKHLMTEMANQPLTGVTPSSFVRRWLQHWLAPQTINGWTVLPRPAMNAKVLTPWPLLGGDLNLDRSPFKLVAIVNRLDLGAGSAPAGYGGSGGGELRFVFAVADRQGGGCSIGRFLVILEYEVPKTACPDVKAWAQAWANLSSMAVGSAPYNAALQALTQQVVLRNTMPAKPNGSAINQIRTNEIMLAGPWELREFRLFAGSAPPSHLIQTTMALTPGDLRNNQPNFANYVNVNTAAILANTYVVPLVWMAQNFLGGNSQVPAPATTFWNGPGIVNPNARHKFSLNTCNGCHAREVNTFFTHINEFGGLSPLLSGPLTVNDPVTGTPRSFDEMLMRSNHLSSVANQSCSTRALDASFARTH